MKSRTFKLAVFIVIVAWLLLFTWPDMPRVRTQLTTPVRIEEDEPGWDCHTMGNRICGPISQRTRVSPSPPFTEG